MMLGETHRANPTVHVPPWPLLHESTPEIFSPYTFQEALNALQHYDSTDAESDSDLPTREPEVPVDAYSCDHFRMFEFKVRRCARGRSHDWTECPYAHPGEKARRRDPRKYHYSGAACPDFRKGSCKKGDGCEYAHGVFECWLHPARYRTQPCKDGTCCRRRVCFFAHTPEQLRVLPQQSPRSGDSYDGSPLRHAMESSSKALPFLESPPVEASSPPMSPCVNEMVASLRNLQLGKVKSLPSSWNVMGSPSPRGGGFFSLPSTPTQVPVRGGVNFFEVWDQSCSEEPVMERVESGRSLRARMFEKLSKENSLDASPSPDLAWVSELVSR
ncbi:zinc finger CCCH domain-containing protein 20 [Cajanus cajan]|uniref:zinc finger CCCH domain-containing protein 20 n=1 Tax=Cajanus cajan TaxID=3821 RepID=UPI00098DD4B9|nr:zinc finger CCCH domain-containing protein 20 [Cajanus cajan]